MIVSGLAVRSMRHTTGYLRSLSPSALFCAAPFPPARNNADPLQRRRTRYINTDPEPRLVGGSGGCTGGQGSEFTHDHVLCHRTALGNPSWVPAAPAPCQDAVRSPAEAFIRSQCDGGAGHVLCRCSPYHHHLHMSHIQT